MKKSKKKIIKTGDRTVNRLYTAVRNYSEKNGGSVLVIGGISIMKRDKRSYYLMVRCLGDCPELKVPSPTTNKER